MEDRWLLLGAGVLFGILLPFHPYQGNNVQAVIATVFTVFGFVGFWWNTTKDEPIESVLS
jgi:hypothetical protein